VPQYLTLQTRRHINRCRYKRVRLYLVKITKFSIKCGTEIFPFNAINDRSMYIHLHWRQTKMTIKSILIQIYALKFGILAIVTWIALKCGERKTARTVWCRYLPQNNTTEIFFYIRSNKPWIIFSTIANALNINKLISGQSGCDESSPLNLLEV